MCTLSATYQLDTLIISKVLARPPMKEVEESWSCFELQADVYHGLVARARDDLTSCLSANTSFSLASELIEYLYPSIPSFPTGKKSSTLLKGEQFHVPSCCHCCCCQLSRSDDQQPLNPHQTVSRLNQSRNLSPSKASRQARQRHLDHPYCHCTLQSPAQ